MVDVARGRRADVITVHQPAASAMIMSTPNPPARLVLWGHFHSQVGPTVIMHDDGSWTVGMQQGTAGGVRQPTITSFSTPFSPPLISADVYFYFRDNATGLITGVQPVHFEPDAKVVIDDRIPTRDLAELPERDAGQARRRGTPTPSERERDLRCRRERETSALSQVWRPVSQVRIAPAWRSRCRASDGKRLDTRSSLIGLARSAWQTCGPRAQRQTAARLEPAPAMGFDYPFRRPRTGLS